MTSYPIYIRFRGTEISATVHKYEPHTLVYFTDNIIIQEFGGRQEFSPDKVPVMTGRPLPKDHLDFYQAITDQLR